MNMTASDTTVTIPASVFETLISNAELDVLQQIGADTPLPVLSQVTESILDKLKGKPTNLMSQLVFFADTFSFTELYPAMEKAVYDLFFEEYDSWEPLTSLGRERKERQFLSLVACDGVITFLQGIENAKSRNEERHVTYEVWQAIYRENYERSSVQFFEEDEVFRYLNSLMWSNMSEIQIHKLVSEEVVNHRKDTAYQFIMSLASAELNIPDGWLIAMYPHAAEKQLP